MDLPKRHKYFTIYKWKYRGVIHNDFNILYEEYINTFNCHHCHKEFITNRNRHLDHCHITGEFRYIVCCACNTHDSYIKYPDGVPSANERQKKYNEENKEKRNEYAKDYRDKNKEKIRDNFKEKYKEKLTEKNTCECSGKYTQQNKSKHIKTKKHIAYTQRLGL